MRLDLFSRDDNVLLVGEGNFSFAKCLVSHNLPIHITATCLDNGVKYKSQLENIEYLIKNRIPVFFDVDATKLHEHPVLKSQIFTKIIFNFPHVGGKMKIQLNRELVRKVFESSFYMLNNDGMLIMSLCNGQGGTPADNPQRKWEDSWQITEMAAYGSFCLISIEPFDLNNFQSYTCTGYRSQDTHFNLNGALVHVFKKKIAPCRIITSDELTTKGVSLIPLSSTLKIFVPSYYSYLYSKNPLNRSKSSISFFHNLLLNELENYGNHVTVLNDDIISVTVESSFGIICQCDGKYLRLRSSAVQLIDKIVEKWINYDSSEKIIYFPAMFFNTHLSNDFSKTPPISFEFILFGKNISRCFKNFLNNLAAMFQIDEIEFSKREIFSSQSSEFEEIIKGINENISNCTFVVEWKDSNNIIAYELHLNYSNMKVEAIIIHVDKLIKKFFSINTWKESWSEESFVYLENEKNPVLKQGILYPLLYKFDITLRYETDKGLSNDDVYETLRTSGIDLINSVELISEYISGLGWSSKCFRITYQSLNEPLNRSRALKVHTNVISKMLTLSLPITIN